MYIYGSGVVRKFLDNLKSYLKRSDTYLLALCLVSTLLGLVAISSAVRYTGSMKSVYVQLGALVMGLFLYFVFSVVDIDILASKWRPLTAVSLLLILSLRWIGSAQGGNRAWIRFAGIGIQPAELIKIVFIVTMAYLTSRYKDRERLDHPSSWPSRRWRLCTSV